MTTKYNPPSVDDIGPSLTSDEIYDSEVGKKFTEALEKQKIEKLLYLGSVRLTSSSRRVS